VSRNDTYTTTYQSTMASAEAIARQAAERDRALERARRMQAAQEFQRSVEADLKGTPRALTFDGQALTSDLSRLVATDHTFSELAQMSLGNLNDRVNGPLTRIAQPGAALTELARIETRLAIQHELLSFFNARSFTVEQATNDGTTAIHAVSGEQHVLLAFDGDELEVDVMGCEGDTCAPLANEITNWLDERGVVMRRRRSVEHDNPRGGERIRSAARQARESGVNLAEGAAATPRPKKRRPADNVINITRGTR
jgi:hypothetical protein